MPGHDTGDVDGKDYILFQASMSGPGVRPPPQSLAGGAPAPGTFGLHGLPVDVFSDLAGRRHALLFVRARHYDLDNGRWLQRDPIAYADGSNLYEAFGGNPLVNRDPSGEYYKLWSTWANGSDVYWQEVTATGWWLTGKPDQELNLGKYYCDGNRKFVVYTGGAAASYERERPPDLYIVPLDAIMEWSKGEMSQSRYGREVYKHGIPMRWSGDGKLEVMPRSEGERGRQDLMEMMDQADRRWAEFANWASTPFGTRTVEMILSGGVDPVTERDMSGKEIRAQSVRLAATGALLYAGATLLQGQAVAGASTASSRLGWISRPPGIQVRRFGNYWVKRVDPQAHWLMKAWGRASIRSQAQYLDRLQHAGRNPANARLFRSGRLVTEDVGPTTGRLAYFDHQYWKARLYDSLATRSVFNDLKPSNYGIGYRAFDPAIDPVTKGVGLIGGTAIGYGAYELFFDDQE